MSLEAYIWACDLPLDACSGTAFRVLLKYADRADKHGRTTWRGEKQLADELGCSTRTVRRARKELLALGLMSLGDQRYVEHIRADRRPTVYDIETPAKRLSERLATGGQSCPPVQFTGGQIEASRGDTWCPQEPYLNRTYQDTHRSGHQSNRAREEIYA